MQRITDSSLCLSPGPGPASCSSLGGHWQRSLGTEDEDDVRMRGSEDEEGSEDDVIGVTHLCD